MLAIVSQCYKSKPMHNPISGHRWFEIEFINRWQVSGAMHKTTYKSAEKAQEWCDWWNSSQKERGGL